MTAGELKFGDNFYFTAWPDQVFTFVGLWQDENSSKKAAKCVPTGKLYPKFFSLKREVVKVTFQSLKNNNNANATN